MLVLLCVVVQCLVFSRSRFCCTYVWTEVTTSCMGTISDRLVGVFDSRFT